MPSYQDIETRLAQVERMLEFTMRAFLVQDIKNPFSKPHTLVEEYFRSLQRPVVQLIGDDTIPSTAVAVEPIDATVVQE